MRKPQKTPPRGESTALTPPTEPEPGSGSHREILSETAPITPSAGLLNPLHQRFCAEFLKDLNATQAYQRAYGGHTPIAPATARVNGARLLTFADIRQEIQRLMDERAIVTGITADRVLLRLWEMANVDPARLVELRVGCCRYCWGCQHHYQYRESELEKAESDYIHREAARRKAWSKLPEPKEPFVKRPFTTAGGAGFNPQRKPHPECPNCHGRGQTEIVPRDNRHLTEAERLVWNGVKVTEHGTQVILEPRLPALKLVGEHLGMWSDKFEGPKDVENPLEKLLREIHGIHGAGSTIPIVHDDPERRLPAPTPEDDVVKSEIVHSLHSSAPRKKTTWRRAS